MTALTGKSYRQRVKKLASRLIRNKDGATAVEFAIIGPVLFAMVFSAIELGYVLTKTALLDTAAGEVSRSIYTGAATNGVVTKADIIDTICETVGLIDTGCKENLTIELTTITDFQSIPATEATCYDAEDVIKPTVSFDPGTTNNIVYMRICLTTNIFTPGIGFGLNLPKSDNGKLQLISELAFSNEPF